MIQHSLPPKDRPTQWRPAQRWQRVARRIRVPLGFSAAALYLFELWRRTPRPAAVAWSLALVLPGLWLRGYASGYVKKNRELTTTGPYAYTRNPLYLGSMLMAAGFAVALLSWAVALVLAAGFAAIYIPVIAAEERFLRATFPGFDAYCRAVPRMVPHIVPRPSPQTARANPAAEKGAGPEPAEEDGAGAAGFSLTLYCEHREYNAAIGAALLYLSLLYLRPAVAAILHGSR
ncbi:MAG: isoprenylcysteine carboxylmethyltransferase family protein [Terracidiphilus sp.]